MTRRLLILLVGAAAIALIGITLHTRSKHAAETAKAAEAKANAERTVPVRTAPVKTADVPIFLEGLGSASAYVSVTVHSQVDGRLDKVSFIEGQTVKKGEVLAQIDPRPFAIQLHQAQAALARDQAQLTNAQLMLTRNQELLQKKLIAQQDVDTQQAQVDQFKAAVQGDQAQIESANLNLDYARITSPIDGITGVRQVDPGNLIHASDVNGIVVVAALDPIAILFTLPQDDLPRVADAMSAGPLDVEFDSRDGSTVLGTGKLLLIDNQINAATATMKLKAIADNPKHVLWPNQFVRARLRLNVEKGVKTLPAAAVQTGPQGMFVYVVKDDNTVDTKPVKVSLVQGDTAILASGLDGTESVVIDGQNQLKPGAKVSVKGDGSGAGGGHAPRTNATETPTSDAPAGGDADRRGNGMPHAGRAVGAR